MMFRGDERGAAIQIGAVILFAFIVIAMASYQATVVPDQNSGVEFNHNQDVQSQMVDLTNGIDASARDGTRGSHAVRLGTTYPSRTLFVNPGSPGGQLRTVESGQIELDITVDDEDNVQTFWNNADPITTNRLQYEPNYNEYRNAPTTVFEHGELINDNPQGSPTPLVAGDIVDDGELSLVTLRGEVQSASSSTVSVDRRSLSSSGNTVTVTDGTITLPIRSDADRYQNYWQQRLAGQDGITNVVTNGATVQFDIDGELDLRMAEVGIGGVSQGGPADRAAYLYQVNTATVEVRDRFNNPVSGVTVQVDGEDRTSGEDGRVSVGADRVGDEIDWSIDGSTDDEKRLTTTVEENDVGSGSGGGSNAYDVEWDTNRIESENDAVSCDGSTCTITDDENKEFFMFTEPPVDGAGVEYASGDRGVVRFQQTDGNTEPDGTDSQTLRIENDGTTNVFVSSGSDGDRIEVVVETNTGSFSGLVEDENGGPVTSEVTFEDDDGNVLGTATPDSGDGSYQVGGVEEGTYDITASADGFEDDTVENVEIVGGTTERNVDFTLDIADGSGSFSGTVRDGDENAIEEEVTFEDGDGNVLGAATPEPNDGSYQVDGVPEGTYDITASADGFEADTVTDVEIISTETTESVDFTLSEAGSDPISESVEATVTEESAADGQPGIEQIEFDWQLSETTDIVLRIYDDDGNEIGSEDVTSASIDGNQLVDVTDGSNSGGDREPRPVVVEATVTDTGETCSRTIGSEDGDGPFELCN